MKKILIFILLLLIVPIKLKLNQEQSIFMTNIYGENLTWKQYPVKLKISTKLSIDQRNIISKQIKELNKAVGFKVFSFEITNKISPLDNGVYLNNLEFRGTEQARTSIRFNYNSFYKVDIFFNEKQLSGIDFATLVRHELFHSIGIKHQDGGLMSEYLSKGVIRDWDKSLLYHWRVAQEPKLIKLSSNKGD